MDTLAKKRKLKLHCVKILPLALTPANMGEKTLFSPGLKP